jgi:hypothetical protein
MADSSNPDYLLESVGGAAAAPLGPPASAHRVSAQRVIFGVHTALLAVVTPVAAWQFWR